MIIILIIIVHKTSLL